MTSSKKTIFVLFVCLGNICRSPAGGGVLRTLAGKRGLLDRLHIESCGIGGWHVGLPADPRMAKASLQRDVVLTGVAVQFENTFFDRFDYIMAADQTVFNDLFALAGDNTSYKSRIHLMTEFSRLYQGDDIPDPYYGGELGFELVLDMLDDSCEGFLDHIACS
jgi:protein-tyrosine phosphatase